MSIKLSKATTNGKESCSCDLGTKCGRFLIDSGASIHTMSNKDWLSELRTGPKVSLINAFGKKVTANQYGKLKLELVNGDILTIRNVLYCSAVLGTLISISRLTKDGNCFKLNGKSLKMYKNGCCIYSTKTWDYIHYLHGRVKKPEFTVNTLTEISSDTLQHFRFGHACVPYLRHSRLSTKTKKFFCELCVRYKLVAGNTSKKIDPHNTETLVATHAGDKIHLDTMGPIPADMFGSTVVFVAIDSWSNYVWAIPVSSKAQIPETTCNLLRLLENQTV